ncbi:MAG: glycosyltransferase, partial [Planctomycetota bacterium]|nr:glycosyltransferase [Planctomycetota bacterium]
AVLDLGAGLGEWAAQALADALGGRVLGAELDPGERLPLEDGSVDLIVAARTLDDLSEEDLARVGHELRRVLRPDGQVHLTIALGREGEVPGRRESLARAFPWLELGPGRVVPAGDRLLGVLSGRAGQAAARPAPRFTLVLVTHEERQATADLLDALDAFTRLPHERVLVDNASTDGTPELLRGRLRPGDLLVENRENHRCARATNQALALSSADLVVYLCARHALVTGPGWDEAVVGYMDEHPDVPLAGDVWSPYAQLLPGRRYRAGWTPEAHGRDRLLHVQGGAFVARRRIFEELGAFAADEYPHANMDVELSYRLLSHGRVLGMSPAISCPPAPAAPRAGALVVHPASDEVRRSVRARLRGPRAAERPPVALVFCERLDNESACESVVRALDEHLEVRPFGPGWPVERLEDVDPTGARFYLELDSASSNLARPVGLERLRVPKLAWLVDTHKKPEHHRRIAREMDLTFFAMQGWGHVLEGETAWLPLHADPRYFHPVEAERRWDLVFVGSQPWRAEPLRRIARRHGLSLHVTRTTGRREKSRTAELYAQARLVFNKHVTNDLNFRVFEATACGRVLLTDAQWNGQYELFEDGKHLVLYKDEADLERQVLRLLGDDALRAEIEQQAAAHAQARHTTAARVRELLARAEAVVGRLPVRAGETADVAGSSEDARAVQVTSPLESAVRACVPRPAGRRRWLVVDGGGAPTVDRQTYAGRLAQVLSSSGHDVLVAHVGSTRRAGVGPREVRLDPGSPPPGATPAQAFLASSAPLQRQLDRLAREHGPFDALLVEGALGQLAGPPLATRLCVPLLLALPTCEVQRRHGRLTRDQLYLAELEHWAADRAAHVLGPWPDVAAAVTARYEVSSPALVAWPASEVRAGGRGDLSARLGLDPPYAVLLGFREARGEPSLSRVALTDEATFVEGGGAQRRLGRRARGRLLAALLAGARAIVARPWDPARADAEDLAPGRVALVEDGPADLSALRFGARTRELDGARAALEGLLADHGQIEAGREEDVHVL